MPSASETTVNARCTRKNACGVLPVKDRLSFAMFLMKVGQMIHDHTPKATRNQDQPRESFIAVQSAPLPWLR